MTGWILLMVEFGCGCVCVCGVCVCVCVSLCVASWTNHSLRCAHGMDLTRCSLYFTSISLSLSLSLFLSLSLLTACIG